MHSFFIMRASQLRGPVLWLQLLFHAYLLGERKRLLREKNEKKSLGAMDLARYTYIYNACYLKLCMNYWVSWSFAGDLQGEVSWYGLIRVQRSTRWFSTVQNKYWRAWSCFWTGQRSGINLIFNDLVMLIFHFIAQCNAAII